MLIPVRCFSCGKVLGNKQEKLERLLAQGLKLEAIYVELGITRYCCKTIIMTHIDLATDLIKYAQLPREMEVK